MKILLITPPMTQLNTPYPATAYLTGFLKQQGYDVCQRDLAIELFLSLLSQSGLEQIYQIIEDNELPACIYNFLLYYPVYSQCVEPTIKFLQGKNPSLAFRIVTRSFLPEGPQFESLYQMEEISEDILDDAFGSLSIQDKAKYLATLFIDDLAKVIQQGVDPNFEISRYGERLAASNPSFDDLYDQLQLPPLYTDKLILSLVTSYLVPERKFLKPLNITATAINFI